MDTRYELVLAPAAVRALLSLSDPVGQELLAAIGIFEEANRALGEIVFDIPVHQKILTEHTGAAGACFASADQKFDVGDVHIGEGEYFGGPDRGLGCATDSSERKPEGGRPDFQFEFFGHGRANNAEERTAIHQQTNVLMIDFRIDQRPRAGYGHRKIHRGALALGIREQRQEQRAGKRAQREKLPCIAHVSILPRRASSGQTARVNILDFIYSRKLTATL